MVEDQSDTVSSYSSDHWDGRRFFNPAVSAPQPLTAVPRMLLERGDPWPPARDTPLRKPDPLDGAAAGVTFIGHSTFLIQTPSGHILTDPIYSTRAGPYNLLGPRRVRPPAVAFEDLPPIDLVLLTHNHYDHCDLRTLRRLARRFDPLVITPPGNARLVRSTGIRRVVELDWWDTTSAGDMQVTATPARHFSARSPFDRDRALWSGFTVQVGGRRLYFAGDTAYAPFFGDIGTRLGPFDLALLPIGAYEPRWFMQAVHMNPAEAVQAHLDLGAPATIGMHFGTFRLTTEGIDAPLRALDDACATAGLPPGRFRALDFGESLRLA
jgi:L-ascorbate metabolism protein UlaG (beta-lactamase superfamily)